jgi:signal transduction histidine kinase/CheY-like chemotaxis protein
MNGVIGGTDLLLDSAGGSNLTAEQKEIISIIRSSGESLLTLIGDILDLSKIEAGRVELEQSKFNVRECVESAIDVLSGTALSKGLELMHYTHRDVPYQIYGDPSRLRQVIVNLLSNAVKFTSKGHVLLTANAKEIPNPFNNKSSNLSKQYSTPKPTISDNSMQLSRGYTAGSPNYNNRVLSTNTNSNNQANTTSDHSPGIIKDNGVYFELHFSIIDTGVGIPPEAHDRLFKAFSQAQSNTTKLYGGTGLGLIISKTLVEMMNGSIYFESQLGKGSTFHFTIKCPVDTDTLIPINSNTINESIPPYLQPISQQLILNNKQLLLIKENQTIGLMILANAEHYWGMKGEIAQSIPQALNISYNNMQHNSVSVILLDYKLLLGGNKISYSTTANNSMSNNISESQSTEMISNTPSSSHPQSDFDWSIIMKLRSQFINIPIVLLIPLSQRQLIIRQLQLQSQFNNNIIDIDINSLLTYPIRSIHFHNCLIQMLSMKPLISFVKSLNNMNTNINSIANTSNNSGLSSSNGLGSGINSASGTTAQSPIIHISTLNSTNNAHTTSNPPFTRLINDLDASQNNNIHNFNQGNFAYNTNNNNAALHLSSPPARLEKTNTSDSSNIISPLHTNTHVIHQTSTNNDNNNNTNENEENNLDESSTNDMLLIDASILSNFASSYPMDICIAEDNTINQKLVSKMLIRLGYKLSQCKFVENGKLAAESIHKRVIEAKTNSNIHPFTCILMDLQMVT